MDRVIRVLIADPDPNFGKLLAGEIDSEADMKTCALAGDGYDALEKVKSLKPDVLITDLMLRKIDGLSLMRGLCDSGCKPHIIVVSGFLNSNLVEKAVQYGAGNFFLKPCRVQSILECVRDCARLESERPEDRVREMTAEMLAFFGISNHLSGFGYLCDAVSLVSLGHMPLQGITKILYPDMAKQHNVSAKDVERCIRHAINHGWSGKDGSGADNNFTRTFSGRIKAPTNREMIAYLSERVKELRAVDERQIF